MFNLYWKTIWDRRFFLIGWSLGIILMAYVMTIFFPTFNDGQLDELLATMPPALQGIVGDLSSLSELPTYLGDQLFEIRLPIFVSILAILLAMGLTVTAEDKGELRTTVSMPISRSKIIWAKWFAILDTTFVATLAIAAGVYLGVWQIGESLSFEVMAWLLLGSWLLLVAMATIIFSIGIATGNRALTMTVAIVLTVGSFILSTFASAVDWLEPYAWLSIFHYFPASEVAADVMLGWESILVYIVLTLLPLTVAFLLFRRRDITA